MTTHPNYSKPRKHNPNDLVGGQKLSDWHRTIGYNCPAVDIDLLLLEFDKGEPVALIEYKHERAPLQRTSHPSYKALITLGNRAELPVFAVRYDDSLTWFRVTALNTYAQVFIPEKQKVMTEPQYKQFLHNIRGYEES